MDSVRFHALGADGKMRCNSCGAELVAGAAFCHACGLPSGAPAPPPPPGRGELDRLVDDAARSAHELAVAALRLSHRVVQKADSAAHDPGAAARKVLHRTSEELRKAGEEIEKALRDLD